MEGKYTCHFTLPPVTIKAPQGKVTALHERNLRYDTRGKATVKCMGMLKYITRWKVTVHYEGQHSALNFAIQFAPPSPPRLTTTLDRHMAVSTNISTINITMGSTAGFPA